MDPAPCSCTDSGTKTFLVVQTNECPQGEGPTFPRRRVLLSEGSLVFSRLMLLSPSQVFTGVHLDCSTERHTYLDTSRSQTNRDGWSLYLYIVFSPQDVNRCSTQNRKEKEKRFHGQPMSGERWLQTGDKARLRAFQIRVCTDFPNVLHHGSLSPLK